MATDSVQKFVVSVFFISLIVVALTSCGNNSSSSEGQGTVSHDGTNLSIAFPVHKFLTAKKIEGLQAKATIDEGDPHTLAVDPVTNQISGTITQVPPGTHDLEITYFVFLDSPGVDVVLCTYSTQVTVNPGEPTNVTIQDTDLDRNYDDDNDGYTNLAELKVNANPLDSSVFPAGESPYVLCGNGSTGIASSPSYDLTAIVGPAVAGKSNSANYEVIVSFTGYEKTGLD